MTPDKLFNCRTDHAAPYWSQFDALEIGGCCDVADGSGGPGTNEAETYIEGGYDRGEAEFFTVYGHIPGEGVEAITDCSTFLDAEAVAAELSRLSGLPVNVMC